MRWNQFGTPASMSSETGTLAEGLSGNAVAVARAWTNENRELFGLSEQSVADLELIYSVPIGAGRAVLFQQRFGDLPAGHDGLLSIGVRGDTVVYVSSSIAPDSAAPGEATVSATEAIRTAAADAGIAVSADQISAGATEGDAQFFEVEGVSSRCASGSSPCPRRQNGVRSAWEVVLTDNGGAEPVGFITYVDAQANAVLLREDLVDYQEDPDPSWDVFPASPPLDYSTVDTRELWCWAGALPGCARSLADAAPSDRAWDVDPATGNSTFTTRGNNAVAFHNWFSTNPFTVGTETATRAAGPRLQLRVDQPVVRGALQPGHDLHVAAAQRHRRGAGEPVRDAQPDARLVVPPGFTEADVQHAGATTSVEVASRTIPSRATPRRAACRRPRRGFPSRDNANQITGPGRDGADHQHVPVAADRRRLLRPVRGRRLRHDRDRARVHPRDQQPHGRRADGRVESDRRPGRWGRAGRTSQPSSSSTSTESCRSPTRTRSPSGPTSRATSRRASATTG